MFIACSCGDRHWGRYGAAGLLLTDLGRSGVLLQRRSIHVHEGGSWSVPGGAIDRGESAVDAALREANEEAGIDASTLTVVRSILGTDHGDWTYTYVVAETERPQTAELVSAGSMRWEAETTTWVDLDRVPSLDLHPAMRASWRDLRTALVQRD